jgi:hypothetical protein
MFAIADHLSGSTDRFLSHRIQSGDLNAYRADSNRLAEEWGSGDDAVNRNKLSR